MSKICSLISEQICDELDLGLASCDALHGHLRNEYENSRLMRLLLKLGFINERPDPTAAVAWSETSDRYILKLFRDYVFHQSLSDGTPVLDCGHIVSVLNKLDAGDLEEIILSSRNGKDLLVVSYADIRRCLENSFLELSHQADPNSIPLSGDSMYANSNSVDPYLIPFTEPLMAYSARGGGGSGISGGISGGMMMGDHHVSSSMYHPPPPQGNNIPGGGGGRMYGGRNSGGRTTGRGM